MSFPKNISLSLKYSQPWKHLLACMFLLWVCYPSIAQIKVEAESGSYPGLSVSTSPGGYSGSGYVSGFTNTQELTLTVNATAGLYTLSIRYISAFGDKGYDLSVNGEGSSGMFVNTGNAFGTQNGGKVLLNSGQNTFRIGKGWGYFGIDYLLLTPTSAPLPAKPPKQLVDPAATASTKGLHSYLIDIYGTKSLSGQADEMPYILQMTGKEPAVGAYDLMDYSPSRREHNNNIDPGLTENNIAWAKKNEGRGIISLVWHWNAPTDLIDGNTDGTYWYQGFYKSATTFDLAATLADKNSTHYQLLIRDIDAMAVQLKKYRDNDIPVLFRPLHEANGSSDDASGSGAWFWWGAKGGAPLKELWQIVYTRLTNYHQLHNLIWVYTGTTHANWYPGDQYVDVLGLDIYSSNQYDSMSSLWDNAQAAMNGKKLVALSESGTLPVPGKIRAYGAWWSWFAMWGGNYVKGKPVNELQALYNDVDVITRDELPNWRMGGGGGTQSPYASVISLPGVVEAENFDNGGEGIAYHDTDAGNLGSQYRTSQGVDIQACGEGGFNVGWTNPGEWLEYTVNVTSAGNYTLDGRIASISTGSLHVEMDGANVSGAIAVPNTNGWQTWQTVSKTVNLTAGQHVMRVVIDGGNFNINKLTFTFMAIGGIVSGQIYRLTARHSGKVLDVSACSVANGANVQQWPWLGGGCQRWKAEATDNGYYRLTAQNSGQVLEVAGAGMANGDNVQQWPWSGAACQQWKIEPTDNGYYKLTARHSGLVLDVSGVSTAEGANVHQWGYVGGQNQQWKLEVVGSARMDVEETASVPSLQLSPNPASESVNLSWKGFDGTATLNVVNAQGKQVLNSQVVNGRDYVLPTAHFAAGLYIIQLQSGKSIVREKLIIQH